MALSANFSSCSISKAAKELIEENYNISSELNFDPEFVLDFEKLKQLSKIMSQENTIFFIVGNKAFYF